MEKASIKLLIGNFRFQFLVVLVFLNGLVYGQKTSVANAAWSTSTTWSPANAPASTDDVRAGNTLTLDQSISITTGNYIFGFNGTVGTGTITSATNSTTVTGSGTNFTTDFSVNQLVHSSTGAVIGEVASVNSATSITLKANAYFAVTNGSYLKNSSSSANVTDAAGGTAYTLTMSNNNYSATENTLVIKSGTTTFEGAATFKNANVYIESGATLIVGGLTMDTQGSCRVYVLSGGTLIVNGDIVDNNNGGAFVVAGYVQVNGNYSTSVGNVAVTGAGSFQTTGSITTTGSSTVFGSTNNCTTGPCSGSSLGGTGCGNSATGAAWTTVISPSSQTVCSSQSTTLTFTTNATSSTTVTFQWQSSTTSSGLGFSNIAGATSTTLTVTPTVNTWYRMAFTAAGCSTVPLLSPSASVTVISPPSIASTTPGSRCGAGTVVLTATPSSGTINWYSVATGGSSLGTGNSFTTPSISTTTTYYVDATTGSCTTPTRTAIVATVNNSMNWTGATNSDWNTGSNWSCGTVPTSLVDVTIPSGGSPTIALNQTAFVNNLNISSGASLTLGSNSTLNIAGNFTNSGTFNNITQGTITFSGSNQTISGSTSSFFNVTSSASGTVTLSSFANLYGTLSVTSGVFAAGSNNLTLISTSVTQAGSIAALPSPSSFTGSIKVERYMDPLGGTFRYISSPVTGSISKPSGIDKLYDYQYSGSVGGWVGASSMTAGKGYAALVYNNTAVTWTASGTTNTDTQLWTFATAGWYLIGNPYPSSIQWRNPVDPNPLTDGWDFTASNNIASTIAITDNHSGSYPNYFRYYDYALGTQTASQVIQNGVIASGQAFWVYVGTGGGNLTVKQAAKSTSVHSFYRDGNALAPDQLAISLQDDYMADQIYLRIGNTDPKQIDINNNLPKLWNERTNVYLVSDKEKEMMIRTFSEINDKMMIPVGVKVSESGNYRLSFANADQFSLGGSLYLIDTQENMAVPVSSTEGYSFTVKDASQAMNNRFFLSISPEVQERKEITEVSVYPNPAAEQLTIEVKGQKSAAPMTLLDMSGKAVRTMEIKKEGTVDISNLTSGLYILKVQTEQGVHIEKVIKQ